MTSLRRVASVGAIVSMLIVASMSGALGPASSTSTASAVSITTGEDCSKWDYTVHLMSFQLVNGEQCDLTTQSEQALEDIQQADANETKTTIHSTAGQLAAGNEQFLAVMSNYGQDSSTVAFSKGEAAAVEALANGANVSEARAAANESISSPVSSAGFQRGLRSSPVHRTLREYI